MMSQTIETTLGDLICAIQDAAQEACINDNELAQLTQTILSDIISKNNISLNAQL